MTVAYAETATSPAVRVVSARGVTKSYALGESPTPVLHGVDLDLDAGEMCAVMGPSGVGKSTLLNCIAGIEPIDAGRIDLLGQDLTTLDDHHRTLLRRKRIGVIYQFFNLVSNLTVYENVVLPYLIDGQRADEAAVSAMLARVGMTQREGHLPSQLSGGEMQLVSIARALVRGPALVLADEPTGNVNVATGRRIMALLAEVVREARVSLLLVTHNPEDAAKADRVVFMRDGAIVAGESLAGADVTPAAVHDRLKALGI